MIEFFLFIFIAIVLMALYGFCQSVGEWNDERKKRQIDKRFRKFLHRDPTDAEVQDGLDLVERALENAKLHLGGRNPTVQELVAWREKEREQAQSKIREKEVLEARFQDERLTRLQTHAKKELTRLMGREPSEQEIKDAVKGKRVRSRIRIDFREVDGERLIRSYAKNELTRLMGKEPSEQEIMDGLWGKTVRNHYRIDFQAVAAEYLQSQTNQSSFSGITLKEQSPLSGITLKEDEVEAEYSRGRTNQKRICFDIEIINVIDLKKGEDLNQYGPFDISCGVATIDGDTSKTWTTFSPGRKSAPYLDAGTAHDMLTWLRLQQNHGARLFAWNGLGFDLRWLGVAADDIELAADIALDLYDPMFQFFIQKGFPVAISSVSKGLGVQETKLMDGADAPIEWARGNYQRVIDYCAGDCRITDQVVRSIEETGNVCWRTRKNSTAKEPMPELLKVRHLLDAPCPDTTKMENPIRREKFYQWIPCLQDGDTSSENRTITKNRDADQPLRKQRAEDDEDEHDFLEDPLIPHL